MAKPKQAYKVYMVNRMVHTDTGVVNITENFIGQTYAVSEKQAVSQIRYREGITDNDLYCPYTAGGYRKSELVARPI